MNMPKTRQLRLVLGDQLTRGLASLTDLDPAQDVVLMVARMMWNDCVDGAWVQNE